MRPLAQRDARRKRHREQRHDEGGRAAQWVDGRRRGVAVHPAGRSSVKRYFGNRAAPRGEGSLVARKGSDGSKRVKASKPPRKNGGAEAMRGIIARQPGHDRRRQKKATARGVAIREYREGPPSKRDEPRGESPKTGLIDEQSPSDVSKDNRSVRPSGSIGVTWLAREASGPPIERWCGAS